LKKLKSEGGDKDGSKENEVRKKFNNIMVSYGLGGTPDNDSGKDSTKTLFKDKKLQRLWEKAELTGMNTAEMIALQEEFKHHQRKVDEYHALLEMAGDRDSKRYNEIKVKLQQEELDVRNTNELSQRGRDLKTNYDRLHRLATNRGEEAEFEEPKVAGLWKLAMNSNFTSFELESIREELIHYQKRLEKMHFLQRELEMVDSRHGGHMASDDEDDSDVEAIEKHGADASSAPSAPRQETTAGLQSWVAKARADVGGPVEEGDALMDRFRIFPTSRLLTL